MSGGGLEQLGKVFWDLPVMLDRDALVRLGGLVRRVGVVPVDRVKLGLGCDGHVGRQLGQDSRDGIGRVPARRSEQLGADRAANADGEKEARATDMSATQLSHEASEI